jgi:hypothetical protein
VIYFRWFVGFDRRSGGVIGPIENVILEGNADIRVGRLMLRLLVSLVFF